MRDIFRGFGAVFYKEALHIRRDAGTLFFSLTMPLMQMFLLGFGIDTNIRHIPTVVYNADGRRESRELIDQLKNSDTFYVMRYVQSDHEMNDIIVAGKARVGIKVPVDYSDKLLHGMSAQVLVLIDGSDSSVAGQAINVAQCDRFAGIAEARAAGSQRDGRRDAPENAVQSGLALAQFFLARLDGDHVAERHDVSHRVLDRTRKRARHARTTVRHSGETLRADDGQAASLFVRRIFRALPDSDLYAIHFSCADSRQRVVARRPRAALSFRGAVARHPDIRQSRFAGGSDAARVSSRFCPACFFPAIFFPAKRCLRFFSRSAT